MKRHHIFQCFGLGLKIIKNFEW